MEKAVWDTIIAPDLRQRMIDKYVPSEGSYASLDRQPHGTSHLRCEGTGQLVYKVTSFYWLLQELVGNWKSGKRLTLEQKTQLLQLLVWNLSRVQQEQTAYDEYKTEVVIPGIETFAEYEVRRKCFDDSRYTIPHAVDIHDVALCETSDEEEYDTSVSRETAEQIAQLMLACKEFQLKVADDLGERESCEID
jgi:hypothetical protein